jgi:DNA-directed RNA polymerase specialized sigma24 family protein
MDIETLVERAADGDESSWRELIGHLEPRLTGLVRKQRFARRIGTNEDDVRNIFTEVVQRLRDDDFRRLRRYLAARAERPAMTFMPWLIVVTKRIAVDYLRAHAEYLDRRHSDSTASPGKWVEHGEMPRSSLLDGGRPPVTNQSTALAMLRYAYTELPPDQVRALELWILQNSFDDIATELELDDAKHASRVVRAALERLRRHFRADE